jgi:hypothetical protein
MGDAMILFGRSQCREGSADQRQKSAEKKYSSDRHVALLKAKTIPSRPQCSLANDSRQRLAQSPLPAALVCRGTARLLRRPRPQRAAARVCLFRG